MLKIKDNVDLKKLGCDMDDEDFLWSYKNLLFNKETRTIIQDQFISNFVYGNDRLDTLYDLIKDGLVEKVEE